MATPIKFGTDGWRAIIAADYTVDNVKRVAEATALYMKQNKMKKAVIGYDTRFGGLLFSSTVARVLGAYGIKCHVGTGFVSTPMVSLGVVKLKADVGIVITASHNPPSYNGYKLKAAFGGPMIPSEVTAVENLIPEVCSLKSLPALDELVERKLLVDADLEGMYLKHARKSCYLKLCRSAAGEIGYDAM